jgi:hypothetical protein
MQRRHGKFHHVSNKRNNGTMTTRRFDTRARDILAGLAAPIRELTECLGREHGLELKANMTILFGVQQGLLSATSQDPMAI